MFGLLAGGVTQHLMRLLFFSDLHMAERPPSSRSKTYADDLFAKLAEVKQMAAGVDVSIFGGDLYHWPRPQETPHKLVRRMIEFLRDWPCPLYIVAGNHDLPPDAMAGLDRTPLGVVLEALRGSPVQLLDGPTEFGAFNLSPGHWTPGIDSDPDSVQMRRHPADEVLNVKIMHSMIMPPGDGYPFPCLTMDKIQTDADVVLLGHMHWETPPCRYPLLADYGDTIYVGPGSIGRTSRSATETDRQVKVTILEWDGTIPQVRNVPLTSMRPAGDVFTWVEAESGPTKSEMFEGYVAALETGLQVDGLSVEDALDAMDKRARPEVVEVARRYLREAGL